MAAMGSWSHTLPPKGFFGSGPYMEDPGGLKSQRNTAGGSAKTAEQGGLFSSLHDARGNNTTAVFSGRNSHRTLHRNQPSFLVPNDPRPNTQGQSSILLVFTLRFVLGRAIPRRVRSAPFRTGNTSTVGQWEHRSHLWFCDVRFSQCQKRQSYILSPRFTSFTGSSLFAIS